jgi:tRNA(adenine34) deaminase
MCAGALYWAQIGKLVYGASDPKRGYTLNAKPILHPKTNVLSGILAHEAESMLKFFFVTKRY